MIEADPLGPAKEKNMKKILTILLLVIAFACMLTMVASAKTLVFVDETGNEMLTCETEGTNDYPIQSYSGDGFPKYDADGDALTWYRASSTTLESGVVQYTVKSGKTKDLVTDDGDGILTQSEIGQYSYLVSITFDEDCGITEFGNNSAGSGLFHRTGNDRLYFLFINIPDSVTKLPKHAFRNCVRLLNVGMSENSKIIDLGEGSFFGCLSMKSIYIPKGVTTLKTDYTSDSTNNSSKYWKTGLFRNCQLLENVIFAEDSKLEVLEKGTFNDCKSLKTITLPNSVKTLHPRAFANCPALEYVNFGAGLVELVRDTEYGDEYISMFQNSTKLKTVVLPATFKAENLADDLHTAFSIEKITVYYAGTEAEFVKLQDKFALAKSGSGNKGITNATYNYISPCVAFYGENHLIDTTIIYPNGFAEVGEKNVKCTRESCTLAEITEASKIFDAFGYSVGEDAMSDGIYAGFGIVSRSAYDEYVSVMGDISYGVVIANASSVNTLATVDENGNVVMTAEKGLIVNISDPEYSVFNISVRGFNDTTAKELSLVIATYVVVHDAVSGEDEISFVQYEMEIEDNAQVNGFNTVTLERAYYNLYPEKKED